ncbi:MAG: beta-propeller fold lactonase family protein [Myxococcota bacterium]
MGFRSALALLAVFSLVFVDPADAARRRRAVTHEAAGRLTFASPQVDPIAVSPDGTLVLVASTTSNQVDVIATASHTLHAKSPVVVGIDPVSIAFKPDGSEAWVSNHVSDTVSVIDTVPASASFLQVVETVQDLDLAGSTLFDEPVGIAFKGDGSQAYVALSSRNDVAIVDTTSYSVVGRVHITAQEPRALLVRGDLLYVAAFESGNKSQVSACENLGDDTHCTLDSTDIGQFAVDPNLPAETKDIIIDDDVGYPDRDLFVFDVSGTGLSDGDPPIAQTGGEAGVTDMGTLLYGLAVTGSGGNDTVFVSQTDARNAVNGADGDNLVDMDNRIFLNQLSRVSCVGGVCGSPTRMDLEPLPEPECGGGPCGADPAAGDQLATPYGIAVSSDGSTLVVTAAASSRIFSYDASGSTDADVLGRLDVGEIPRGLAFVPSGPSTDEGTLYVLNTLDNSVSVVTLATGGALSLDGSVAVNPIPVGNDPTPSDVRLGRIAFNDADAASTGTFACASCHPDGNTDQLLWRIGGNCVACSSDEPRTTMPIRGLRDSIPLHWDGTLGDPFGGNNGSDPGGNFGPSVTQEGSQTCGMTNQSACFLHLVEASLSGVMCDQASCSNGPSGQAGLLDDTERANMANFLESVSYPPARSRALTDVVSTSAINGFRDFFMDDPDGRGQGISNAVNQPETCADSDAGCHELPLGTGTNSETLQGFDAPTMRGMTDRFLQFSLGITGTQELLVGMNNGVLVNGIPSISQPFGTWSDAMGFEEEFTFGVAYALFNLVYGGSAVTIFQMFEEASTGLPGALGRQVTLNSRTTDGALLAFTEALLAELEAADEAGVVNLRGTGLRNGIPVTISYKQNLDQYQVGGSRLTSAQLVAEAQPPMPTLIATLTAHLRAGTSEAMPQPLLAPIGAQCSSSSGSADPILPSGSSITIESNHVSVLDKVVVNGVLQTGASISSAGSATTCGTSVDDRLTPDEISISGLTLNAGTNLVQVRSNSGLLSNELPVNGP